MLAEYRRLLDSRYDLQETRTSRQSFDIYHRVLGLIIVEKVLV